MRFATALGVSPWANAGRSMELSVAQDIQGLIRLVIPELVETAADCVRRLGVSSIWILARERHRDGFALYGAYIGCHLAFDSHLEMDVSVRDVREGKQHMRHSPHSRVHSLHPEC